MEDEFGTFKKYRSVITKSLVERAALRSVTGALLAQPTHAHKLHADEQQISALNLLSE